MHDFLLALSINLTILIVWFHTNVFVDYANVFGLGNFFKNFNKATYYSLYTQYLKENKKIIAKNPCCLFYLKLITCPICLNFWLSILVASFLIELYYFPVLYIASLFAYFIFNKIVQH